MNNNTNSTDLTMNNFSQGVSVCPRFSACNDGRVGKPRKRNRLRVTAELFSIFGCHDIAFCLQLNTLMFLKSLSRNIFCYIFKNFLELVILISYNELAWMGIQEKATGEGKMERKRNPLLWIVGAVLAVAVVVLGAQWLGNRNEERIIKGPDISTDREDDSSEVVRAEHPPLSEALGVDEADFVEVGGVKRPKRDVAFDETKTEPAVSEKSPFPHPGNAPAIPKDANADVAALHAELAKEKPTPAAMSSLFAPEAFDQKKYDADRKAWLSMIRPGRAFQPAQPGPEVEPIKSSSGVFQQVVQGEKVIPEVIHPGGKSQAGCAGDILYASSW